MSVLTVHGRYRDYRSPDMTGRVFGQLVVLGPARRDRYGVVWLCLCSCGQETEARQRSLVSNDPKTRKRSCGCLQASVQRERLYHHGHGTDHTRVNTYNAWLTMKSTNIAMRPEWECFEEFLSDMGVCPEGHMLSRLNLDRGYFPDNVEWVPMSVGRSRASRSKWKHDFSDERYTRA